MVNPRRALEALEKRRLLAKVPVADLAYRTGIPRSRLAALLEGPRAGEVDRIAEALAEHEA